jgi:hypothetical protein
MRFAVYVLNGRRGLAVDLGEYAPTNVMRSVSVPGLY